MYVPTGIPATSSSSLMTGHLSAPRGYAGTVFGPPSIASLTVDKSGLCFSVSLL